jgi:hypothetical protein
MHAYSRHRVQRRHDFWGTQIRVAKKRESCCYLGYPVQCARVLSILFGSQQS